MVELTVVWVNSSKVLAQDALLKQVEDTSQQIHVLCGVVPSWVGSDSNGQGDAIVEFFSLPEAQVAEDMLVAAGFISHGLTSD